MTYYGVTTDYDYCETHKRDRIDVWSGPFMSEWVADGYSLPKGDGYMLTTYWGEKIRVECPTPRTDATYSLVDDAIRAALNEHEKG